MNQFACHLFDNSMVKNEDNYEIIDVQQTCHKTPIACQHIPLQVNELVDVDYLLDEAENIMSILHVSELLLVFEVITLALAKQLNKTSIIQYLSKAIGVIIGILTLYELELDVMFQIEIDIRVVQSESRPTLHIHPQNKTIGSLNSSSADQYSRSTKLQLRILLIHFKLPIEIIRS